MWYPQPDCRLAPDLSGPTEPVWSRVPAQFSLRDKDVVATALLLHQCTASMTY